MKSPKDYRAAMVSTTAVAKRYPGNNSSIIPYVTDFPTPDAQAVSVFLINELGVVSQLNSGDFLVTGQGMDNHNFHVKTYEPVVATTTVEVRRTVSATQLLDLISNSRIPAEGLEAELDKIVMFLQQIQDWIVTRSNGGSGIDIWLGGRSIAFPPAEPLGNNTTLPLPVDRRGKLIFFDPTTGEMTLAFGLQDVAELVGSGFLKTTNSLSEIALAGAQSQADSRQNIGITRFYSETDGFTPGPTIGTPGNFVLAANGTWMNVGNFNPLVYPPEPPPPAPPGYPGGTQNYTPAPGVDPDYNNPNPLNGTCSSTNSVAVGYDLRVGVQKGYASGTSRYYQGGYYYCRTTNIEVFGANAPGYLKPADVYNGRISSPGYDCTYIVDQHQLYEGYTISVAESSANSSTIGQYASIQVPGWGTYYGKITAKGGAVKAGCGYLNTYTIEKLAGYYNGSATNPYGPPV